MAFKMKNPSVAKMAKMAGDNRSAAKFNAGLRKASAEGKLDNNPKFKDAVDSAPMKLKKQAAMKKGHKKTPEEKAAIKEQRKKNFKADMAELKAYPQNLLGAAKHIVGLGKDKSVPQKLLKGFVRVAPREVVKTTRDVATGAKELVQKGVKAVGKGAKKAVSKVKNRKKKNK
jgi:hypothetical protein